MVSKPHERGSIVLPCAKRVYFGYVQVAVDPLGKRLTVEGVVADYYEEH